MHAERRKGLSMSGAQFYYHADNLLSSSPHPIETADVPSASPRQHGAGACGPKVLVISLAGIGDTLLATPLVRELRANFPEGQLDALVLWSGSKDILQGNPHLNTVFQNNLFKASKMEMARFLNPLRKARYDVSINTHPQSRIHYRLLARLIGARLRLSHHYECAGLLDRWLVHQMLPQDYQRHSVDQNLNFLPALGKKALLPTHELELFLSATEQQWAEQFLTTNRLEQRRRLGLHVGSGGTKNLALKRWPLAHYIELVGSVRQSWPEVAVLLFGGPDEDAELAKLQAVHNSPLVLRVRSENLRQAAALMQHCSAFLSVDTALMHLAAAVKVPRQIVIEAPTFNKTNEPYGNPYSLVPNPAVAGRNLDYYRYDGRGIKGTREELLRCMASVSVDAVYDMLAAALR
jgi:ADP-heptose:LPS heptosyltransferase